MSSRGIGVGIVISDIAACLPFYRDTLGLTLTREFDVPGGTHVWNLACGDSNVKLVAHANPPEAANPPGGAYGGTGLRYWTMPTDDIEAAVAKCVTAGAPIQVPVLELEPGTRIAMIEDPEGNVIELLEQAPG